MPARQLIGIACLGLGACSAPMPPVTLHDAAAPPARLSDWGVLASSGRTIEFNERVLPYELNTPLFSDYALKLRTVWLPEGRSAQYTESGPIEFPVGTIISKTFHYEKAPGFSATEYRVLGEERESLLDADGRLDLARHVLVETRLLVRYEAGWKALPYVWNDTQTDAFLEVAGDVRAVTLVRDGGESEFVYVVPDMNQCAGCHATDHTSGALQPIGPKAWQLNRDYAYPGGLASQLDTWHAAGLLNHVPPDAPRAANWLRPADATLEARARAYLDVNCAHCHNSRGAADTSGLDLEIDTPLERSFGICKPPVAVGQGSGDRPYDIYPGRPADSIMIYRMQHTNPAIAMPELGRATVHRAGVQLLSDWVTAMPGDC